MIHKIISSFGLGVLGIDFMASILLLSMSLKNNNKTKISAFMFSFMFFAVVIGALISVLFGTTAIDYVNSLIPNDNSPFWIILEIIILIITIFIIIKRVFKKEKQEKKESSKVIDGGIIKYIGTGILFALTSFTDPTYYGVILLGSEGKTFISAVIFIGIWFIVSQVMALVTYIAIMFNFTGKLTEKLDKLKNKYKDKLSIIFNIILITIAILLIIDLIIGIVTNNYLF